MGKKRGSTRNRHQQVPCPGRRRGDIKKEGGGCDTRKWPNGSQKEGCGKTPEKKILLQTPVKERGHRSLKIPKEGINIKLVGKGIPKESKRVPKDR